jgi:Reverse transcriptase-like
MVCHQFGGVRSSPGFNIDLSLCCETEHCSRVQCVKALSVQLSLCDNCYDEHVTRDRSTQLHGTTRNHCATEHCTLVQGAAAIQAKRPLCDACYDIEVTRGNNIQVTVVPAPPTTKIPRKIPEDNTYAMSWTDGGRRNVTIGGQKLSNVGGWAYLLLCGRGQKYVSSSSLGPDSTNNIAEFTAILQVVVHAVSVRITQLDIKTDCMLAVQYYDVMSWYSKFFCPTGLDLRSNV